MAQSIKRVHLFNCDNTYKLEPVVKLLEESKRKLLEKLTIQIEAVEKHSFRLAQMSVMVDKIQALEMDMAFFVVHAHESRLSINEDSAGIGYAKIYRALLQATGGNVIIVIGKDDNYKGDNEENREVISRWAKRKVSSQFGEEYLDGRKSFIFSWNKQHRAIHEQALLHHFDPNKKGQKFEYQPLPIQGTKPESPPQATLAEFENPRAPNSPSVAKEKPTDNHPSGVSNPKIHIREQAGEERLIDTRDRSRNTLPSSSGETKDLAILGCNVSPQTMDDVRDILEKHASSLHLSEDPTLLNLEPDKVEQFLIKNQLRFCVLVVDASTLKDGFQKGTLQEYQPCLETALQRVVTKVIILVCNLNTVNLSLTQESVVKQLMGRFENCEEKLSIAELNRGMFGVSKVDFIKILTQLFKSSIQINCPRDSQEPDSSVDTFTTDPLLFGERTNPPAKKSTVEKCPPNIHQLPSQSSVAQQSVLLLRGIFRYGTLSDDWGDIHIRNLETEIPGYIFEELLRNFSKIPEVGVRIIKQVDGRYLWKRDQNLRRFSLNKEVELKGKEKLVLKTRVRNGEVSFKECDVQFLLGGIGDIPRHIFAGLKEKVQKKPYGDLYIISDDAGGFRSVVKSGLMDRTVGTLVQKKEEFGL